MAPKSTQFSKTVRTILDGIEAATLKEKNLWQPLPFQFSAIIAFARIPLNIVVSTKFFPFQTSSSMS